MDVAEDDDGDPGIVIIYAAAETIHRALHGPYLCGDDSVAPTYTTNPTDSIQTNNTATQPDQPNRFSSH